MLQAQCSIVCRKFRFYINDDSDAGTSCNACNSDLINSTVNMLVSRANFMASFVVHFECFIAKALIASFNKCLLTNLNALLPESSSVNENLKKKPVPSMSINKLD